jgi:NAD+ diphosphatase
MKYCPWCGTLLGTREIERREHPACPDASCGYVFWDNPLPVVAAVVEQGDSVILVRAKGWPEKIFGLVTGFLEKGEDPAAAVIREVREELGLKGTVRDLVGVYPFTQKNQVLMVYHVVAEGEVAIGDELEEMRRIAPDRLRPWAFGTGPAVRDWLEKRKGG